MGSVAILQTVEVAEQDSDYVLSFSGAEVNFDRSQVTRAGRTVEVAAAE